jgi:hypothetical protein
MKVLGFKKWYEHKERKGSVLPVNDPVKMVSPNIFKAPQKMLQIEVDVLTESINPVKSKNVIDRFYLTANSDLYTGEDLKVLKDIIKESKNRGTNMYLIGYDFSSADPKKCFKNSIRIVQELKNNIQILSGISHRGLGSMERINENHQSYVTSSILKQRIELVECHFDPEKISSKIEIPFYFNPNDFSLLEKYQVCLRGIITQFILSKETFEMDIKASKPWPESKRRSLLESDQDSENLSEIFEMKYPHPHKSSLLYPQNKPNRTDNKISVIELTEKRASSVVNYLSGLTMGMPIKFNSIGFGYKEGNPTLQIEVR